MAQFHSFLSSCVFFLLLVVSSLQADLEATLRANQAAEVIFPLVESLDMPRDELLSICLTIEETLKKNRDHSFRVEQGPRTIEYDHKSKNLFIHLGNEGASLIEQGYYKRVTKSILYDLERPELVANCRGTLKDLGELKITERFQGLPGIVEARALIAHRTRNAGVELLLKHYNAHSLRTIFNAKSHQFTFDEKKKIAYDILRGLAAIHKRGYVHRDLHSGNYLVEVKGKDTHRHVAAVITDFGKTMRAKRCKGISSQAALEYRGPESVNARRLKNEDYFATDIYATGCVFYKLYSGKEPPWFQDRSFFIGKKVREKQKQKANREYRAKIIKSHTASRRAHLRRKVVAHTANHEERFEFMILSMLHPDSKQRKSASYWKKFLAR